MIWGKVVGESIVEIFPILIGLIIGVWAYRYYVNEVCKN